MTPRCPKGPSWRWGGQARRSTEAPEPSFDFESHPILNCGRESVARPVVAITSPHSLEHCSTAGVRFGGVAVWGGYKSRLVKVLGLLFPSFRVALQHQTQGVVRWPTSLAALLAKVPPKGVRPLDLLH